MKHFWVYFWAVMSFVSGGIWVYEFFTDGDSVVWGAMFLCATILMRLEILEDRI